jgi:hypothetical protein
VDWIVQRRNWSQYASGRRKNAPPARKAGTARAVSADDPIFPILRSERKRISYIKVGEKTLDSEYTYLIISFMLFKQRAFPRASNQANSFVPMPLQPLGISCLSFCNIFSLFSITCGLFLQNAGGVGSVTPLEERGLCGPGADHYLI